MRVTDYLDWTVADTKGVLTYCFQDRQTFIASQNPTGGAGNTGLAVSKIKKITVWALPRSVNAANATSMYQTLFSVPCLTSVNNENQSVEAQDTTTSMAQMATTVNPTFNVKWTKIGYANFDHVFRSSQLLPVRVDASDGSSSGWACFQLSIIDPDNNTVVTDAVQLAVTVEFAQTLPIASAAAVSVAYSATFGAPPTPLYANQYMMTELVKVQNQV